MQRKIALEEHLESPDFMATGTHNFTDPAYFEDVENRLQEYKLRLQDMDATGIETTILSLSHSLESRASPARRRPSTWPKR
jgi:hypothetical protein